MNHLIVLASSAMIINIIFILLSEGGEFKTKEGKRIMLEYAGIWMVIVIVCAIIGMNDLLAIALFVMAIHVISVKLSVETEFKAKGDRKTILKYTGIWIIIIVICAIIPIFI